MPDVEALLFPLLAESVDGVADDRSQLDLSRRNLDFGGACACGVEEIVDLLLNISTACFMLVTPSATVRRWPGARSIMRASR